MMITSREIKIKIPDNLTSACIENELQSMGLDVLRWAIVNYDDKYYTINAAIAAEN